MALVVLLLLLKTPVESVLLLRVSVPPRSEKMPAGVQSVGDPDNDKFMSDLLTSVFRDTAVAATVTVAAVPELASKKTLSAFVGALAPEAPPEVSAQFAVELLFHVPLPPTQ